MRLPPSGRRGSTQRPSLFLIKSLSGSPNTPRGNISGRGLRVPPTGIPRPDQEDAPPGAARPLWRAAGAALLTLVMMAGHGTVSAASEAKVSWQVDPGVGIRAIIGASDAGGRDAGLDAGRDADSGRVPPQDGVVITRRAPRQMAAADWHATPVHTSQTSGAADLARPAPAVSDNSSAPAARQDLAPVKEDKRAAVSVAPTVLPVKLRQAILLDPRVAEMSARACQMAHRVGLARAEGRPKLTATVSGSRQIASRIKKYDQPRYDFRTGRSIYKPGHREIAESGAHHREFEHRQKNNIYDGKISLRHTIIDWGQRGSRTEARSLGWQAAQIDARVVMRERSHDMLQLSLSLRRSDEVIAALTANFEAVSAEVEAVRARVEAGAGRLSDLREAQLVQLDQEIAINRAEAERDIILEHLETEFNLTAEDGWRLAQAFLARRHPDLAILPADRTDKAHAIRLRARGVTHEADEIRASRYPKFDAVIDGTIFDMTDYEDEYEVVGKIEMSVPLYDGGTARARLRETAWRENELKSSLEALVRSHSRETEGLAKRFNQMTREETEALARRDELAAQLRSLRERQGKTISSPLALARLQAQMGAAEARLAEIRFDRELLRARALLVAEQIESVLGLSMEDSVC